MEEEGPNIYGKLLYPEINNCILVVRDHITVANMFSPGLDYLLELGLCELSVVCPVFTDPDPMGD